MKIFYDTEFLEDGRTIELISIGMVAEDGRRELYAVAEEIEDDPLFKAICRHRWLMDNVVPHLPLDPRRSIRPLCAQFGGYFALDSSSNVVMPKRMIRNLVREFVLATPEPELWAWFGGYDHVVYAQLFGRMAALPDGCPMWTNDVRTLYMLRGDPAPPVQSGTVHNALDDARHVRVMLDALSAPAGVRCDACGEVGRHTPRCPELGDALDVQERDHDDEDLDDDEEPF